MNKMKYQAGGAVDSTDDISAEKLAEMMQQQKDAAMDENMQEGMENYNKRRVGGKTAKDEAAAKKGGKKGMAKPKPKPMAPKPMPTKPKPVDPEGMNMGGMVGYKKGGKVRGCGIATQGVRKAKGSY